MNPVTATFKSVAGRSLSGLRSMLMLGIALGGIALTRGAAGQNASAQVSPEFLLLEIRNLRIELFEDRLERQQQKVEALERHLQRVRAARTAIQEDLRSHRDDLAQWNAEFLQAANLSGNERSQLEAGKTAMASDAIRELQQQAAARGAEETAVQQALQANKERLTRLRESLTALRQRW
jgi:hypothetical protein